MTYTQPIPLLDLKAQYAPIREECREAFDRVADAQYFIGGPEVDSLEKEIAAYSQCQYGIGVTSGTDALLVALMTIGVQPGDEVITTPYTFFATGGCIPRMGAVPVFVDIEPGSYNINPALIEAAITPKTKAIMPVHLYGQMADMDPIMAIAQRHNLYVIEDAAQAIGAEYKGRRAGSIGHFGCFSFFPSKNLGAFGDGGMITANDPALAHKAKLLRNHGTEPKYYHKLVGGNFRLDALQAAVLRIKLRYLDGWTAGRQQNAERYRRLFAGSGATGCCPPHRSPRAPAHLQPVRDPHRPPRRRDGTAEGTQDRARNLLPRAAAPAGVLREPGLSARQPARERARGARDPGTAHLPGAHRGDAGRGRGRHRRGVCVDKQGVRNADSQDNRRSCPCPCRGIIENENAVIRLIRCICVICVLFLG